MPKNRARNKLPKQSKQLSVREEVFSGPLPPPSVFQQYDQVLPGAAERILTLAESQSAHRQDLESKVINSDVGNSRLGLVLGFIVQIAAVVASYLLIMNDKIYPGSALGITALGAMFGSFAFGSRQRRLERQQKQ